MRSLQMMTIRSALPRAQDPRRRSTVGSRKMSWRCHGGVELEGAMEGACRMRRRDSLARFLALVAVQDGAAGDCDSGSERSLGIGHWGIPVPPFASWNGPTQTTKLPVLPSLTACDGTGKLRRVSGQGEQKTSNSLHDIEEHHIFIFLALSELYSSKLLLTNVDAIFAEILRVLRASSSAVKG